MADRVVRVRLEDGVAVLRMMQPPTNVLNRALCVGLQEALGYFIKETSVAGIVITADEDTVFSAGMDLGEFDAEAGPQELAALCQMIEEADKPIVAALTGAALGAGAELALAAHYRVARGDVRIGFPDVGLGLPPGAGGTQRLPRLVGAKVAIQLLQSGRPVDEMVAHRVGLVNHLVPQDVVGKASEMAMNMPPRPTGARRDHLMDGATYMQAITAARRGQRDSHVARRIVDCVEAALLLPSNAAMAFEQGAWAECAAHRESRALRHVFLAERRGTPELTDERKPTVQGQAIVARLFAAQDRAIVALVRAGMTEAEIDAALVAFGYVAGPFGGRSPAEGPSTQSLQRRIIAAIMAEGARCLEQGIVARSSDLDVLAVHAMGFPRDWGGPMKAAEFMGLLGLSRQMQGWAQEDPVWQVPELMKKAALGAHGFAAVGP